MLRQTTWGKHANLLIPPPHYPIGSMYAIYGNMDPINIPPMLAYIPYMDPMGIKHHLETMVKKIGNAERYKKNASADAVTLFFW